MDEKNLPTLFPVSLVGAGPGDPGLITQKGLQRLLDADVVFYDHLVHPRLLQMVNPFAECIDVGKCALGIKTDQREIEDRLVEAAKSGKKVVRLKGGDPFIFGRGAEEAERLYDEKLAFEIIPGVSAGTAAAAYAGIPLTHRDLNHTVVFLTGHSKNYSSLKSPPEIDFSALARLETLVIFMGVKTLRSTIESLIKAGKDPKTPVALIHWGTYPNQKVLIGNIAEIADLADAKSLQPPALIVVGEVVRLREKLNWFEKRPLFGKKILVTRTRVQASVLADKLENLGAEVWQIPTIEIVPVADFSQADRAICNLNFYDGLIFTSGNSVDFFLKRVFLLGKDLRVLGKLWIAAVGSETAKALQNWHLCADFIPKEFRAGALIECFKNKDLQSKRILFPSAKDANVEWIKDFETAGAQIDRVLVYQNQLPSNLRDLCKNLHTFEGLDLITFASSSAVQNFLEVLDQSVKTSILKKPVLCIGPVTEAAAREQGFCRILPSPSKPTIRDLVERVLEYLSCG